MILQLTCLKWGLRVQFSDRALASKHKTLEWISKHTLVHNPFLFLSLRNLHHCARVSSCRELRDADQVFSLDLEEMLTYPQDILGVCVCLNSPLQ